MNIITAIITYTVFLPVLFKPIDINQRLGAYWWNKIEPQYIVPGQWIKLDVPWNVIEETKGVYLWPNVLNTNIAFLKSNGNPILFNFHNSPDWARDTNTPCTLPNENNINNYIAFVSTAIERYRPQAIEIWNEPESISSAEMGWCCGCIKNPQDYTNVLNKVYQVVKQKYPDVTVLAGAFTQLDSEWINTWFSTGPKMDALSFHYYSNYSFGSAVPSTSALVNRITYFKNKTNVPIWLTETALLCDSSVSICANDFRFQQELWLQSVYPLSGLNKIFWFSENEVWWNNCNMLNERNNIVFPVYNSFYKLVTGNRRNSAERTMKTK